MNDLAIAVLLVEDNAIVRTAQMLTLRQFPDIVVTSTAQDGPAAVQQAESTNPDVILMDIGLPGIDGIEATKIIRDKQLNCRVVVLTAQASDKSIFDALAVGADAFCDKDISGAALAQVIRLVAGGQFWLDSSVADRILRYCMVEQDLSPDGSTLFYFGTDQKFVVSEIEYAALYRISRFQPATVETLSESERVTLSELLRNLFSRISQRDLS